MDDAAWERARAEERSAGIGAAAILGSALVPAAWALMTPRGTLGPVLALGAWPYLAAGVVWLARRGSDVYPDPRPASVALATLAMGLLLFGRSGGGHLISVAPLTGWILGVAATLGAAFGLMGPGGSERWIVSVGFGVLGLPFGLALAIALNAAMPSGPVELFEARVRERLWFPRSGSSVTLAPFGPMRTTTRHGVSVTLYRRLEVGGTACVAIHHGALGASWTHISERCPSDEP